MIITGLIVAGGIILMGFYSWKKSDKDMEELRRISGGE